MVMRVEELFHKVADLSREARAQYFAKHAIDAATQKEVEALVAFDSHASKSLERDIGAVAERALARLDPKDIPCGRFKLGKLLGRGGMGAVYLGERVDGEVTQTVAIKLLRPGGDDPELRRRFLAERQILATLSHPQIARLLDAGHREDGQPYLVMEYVKGEPIDVYTAKMSVRQKLLLFVKVCAAVSYLHRNLVVHRDLKPSNILVTAEGEPKLLDFGLAKMLDLTTDSTMTSMRMLTPDYASPEQVLGGPVTTATDIYSLGAVLYELLTEECPHKFEGDSVAAIATAISVGKIVPPSKLAPVIKSDLEMIVMKALRREPQDRYATIDQFAEDLENFLESRPIRARKGDTWYRTRIYLRRHWLPVTAALLAIGGLSAGLMLANRERVLAQQRFLDVRQLSNKLFDIDSEASKIAGSSKVRQLIVDTSIEYLQRLASDTHRNINLDLELGTAYFRVARVQGLPNQTNLGQIDQAEQTLGIAEKLIDGVLAAQPSNRMAILRKAQIVHGRLGLLMLKNRERDAHLLTPVLDQLLKKFDARADDIAEQASILGLYGTSADQYSRNGRFEDAIRLTRRGEELARLFDRPAYVGTLHYIEGNAYRKQGNLEDALSVMTESVKILKPQGDVPQSQAMGYIMSLIRLGRILGDEKGLSLGRSDEAAVTLQNALDVADEYVHKDRNDQMSRGRFALAALDLAKIVHHSDPQRALGIYDHLLFHMGENPTNQNFRRNEISALAGSVYPLRMLGRTAEARARIDTAFEKLRQLHEYPVRRIEPSSQVDETLCALAEYEAGKGNVAKAVEIYKGLLDRMLAWPPHPDVNLEDACDVSRVYAALAGLYRRRGNQGAASALDAKRSQLWQGWEAKLPRNAYIASQVRAASGDGLRSGRSGRNASSGVAGTRRGANVVAPGDS
jgi:serine/threonine protein kinase